jgi:hypothetical protein
MQGYFETVRDEVWLRMQRLFEKYTQGSPYISSGQIEAVLR